jgi:hypothetical protein
MPTLNDRSRASLESAALGPPSGEWTRVRRNLIPLRPLFVGLGTIWLVLILASIAQDVLGLSDTGVGTLFDVDSEKAFYTWYSQLLLSTSGILLGMIALARGDAVRRIRLHWAIFSGLLFFASLDEAIGIHEHLGMVLHQALHTRGLFFFPWTIPYGLAVAAGLFAALPFFRSLPRSVAIRFGVAAGVYLSGAIGCEMIGGLFMEEGPDYEGGPVLQVMKTTEEALEGLGGLIFLHSLLGYFQDLVAER